MPSSNFKMVCYIMIIFSMLLMALHSLKNLKLSTIHWLHAILDSTRPWISCFETISDHNFGNMWGSLLDLMMFMFEQIILVITFMVSFNHCRSLHPNCFQFPWTLSWTFHLLIVMTPSWWWCIIYENNSFYSMYQNNN
jgi:hypothetical protein